MKRTSLILIFLIATSFYSCKKEEEQKVDLNEKEFLSYWLFEEESYWVYRQSGTNFYDTVKVIENEKQYHLEIFKETDYHSKGTHYSTYLSHTYLPIYGGYYGNAQEYRSGAKRVKFSDWIMVQNFNTTNPNPPILGNFITFNYPYQFKEPIWFTANVDQEITLETLAGSFEKTVVVRPHAFNWYDSIEHNFIKEIYMTPNVGTTKIVMTNNIVWELVNFKVEAYR